MIAMVLTKSQQFPFKEMYGLKIYTWHIRKARTKSHRVLRPDDFSRDVIDKNGKWQNPPTHPRPPPCPYGWIGCNIFVGI